jgi:hypothetical protein
VFAGFGGTGSFSSSYDILAGAFVPNSSLFTLSVLGGGIRIMATNVSWARVVVPKGPIIAEMLIVLLGFAWLVKSGPRRHFRNPLVLGLLESGTLLRVPLFLASEISILSVLHFLKHVHACRSGLRKGEE